MRTLRFHGCILGAGSESGVRIVVGHWPRSPLGSFSDVMIQTSDDVRILLAPSDEVATFVSDTYNFDEIRKGPVDVAVTDDSLTVVTDDLTVRFSLGGPTRLNRLFSLVPTMFARSPLWNTVIDPLAGFIVPGVHTRGSAKSGRSEFYGVTAQRHVTGLSGTWLGADVGQLRPVEPAVRFGFSSTPPTPSLNTVITTIIEK